jgi:hypothetical protein
MRRRRRRPARAGRRVLSRAPDLALVRQQRGDAVVTVARHRAGPVDPAWRVAWIPFAWLRLHCALSQEGGFEELAMRAGVSPFAVRRRMAVGAPDAQAVAAVARADARLPEAEADPLGL